MSKFFIQMLLSMAVAVSAAVGLSPDVKKELEKAAGEMKAFVHDLSGALAEAEVEPSTEIYSTSSLAGEVETGVEIEPDVAFNKASKKSRAGLEASLASQSESQVEAGWKDAELELENELESDLELEVGIGN